MQKENYFALWHKAHDIINANLTNKEFRLINILKELYVSESTLKRVFEKYGESPRNKFIWCRLALFCQRLQESEDSIVDIGKEFGFTVDDEKQFYRWFKDLKCTPSEYREKMRYMLNGVHAEEDMDVNVALGVMLGSVESLEEIMSQSEKRWRELATLAKQEGDENMGLSESISYLCGYTKKVEKIIKEIKEYISKFISEKTCPSIEMAKLLSELEYNTEQIILQKDLILFCCKREAGDIIFNKCRNRYDDVRILCSCIDENQTAFKKSLSLLRRHLLETDLRGIDIIDIATRFGTNVETTLYIISLDDPASKAYGELMEEYNKTLNFA